MATSSTQKKLRKEVLRYRPMLTTMESLPSAPSPPTPKDFVIRTPSPKFAASVPLLNVHPSIPQGFGLHTPNFTRSTSMSTLNALPPMNCLPFSQFNSAFSNADNPLLSIPETDGSHLVAISQDIYTSILEELRGSGDMSVSGAFSETIKALLPENIFPSNIKPTDIAISQQHSSPVLEFLKLSVYLISNNLLESTDAGKKVYQWIKRHSNAGLMEYLLSIAGPTAEALTEKLFPLAIDAEDVLTVNKLMKLGIDPNEYVYRDQQGSCRTPLHQACEMQSLKLVRALIDGGAKVDLLLGNEDTESILASTVGCFDDEDELKSLVDPELVKVLLDAGAVVNPTSGESPLENALEWGHVEVVNLLVSAGADVNITVGDDDCISSPLIKAIRCIHYNPTADIISMVRILLKAGADPRAVCVSDKTENPLETETPLEAAMCTESVELILLLLENGAQVTENSLVRAVRCCNINIVELLLKFGGKVTELVAESAVERNPALVFFLLEAADDRTRKACKNAALTKSIECGDMDLFHTLGASGAQLIKNHKLEGAIEKVAALACLHIFRLLLDEKSGYRNPTLESLDSALWAAINNDQNDIAELLLKAGASVNNPQWCGLRLSPLTEAISKKDSKIAKQLLVAGAAVNAIERAFHSASYPEPFITTTVLPAAVDWGYRPLIQDIINAGAEIDAPEKFGGKTALYVAVEKGSKEIVELLVDAGADINAGVAAIWRQPALVAACRNNDLHMVQYLIELGADLDEMSLIFAVSGGKELVQAILEAPLYRYKRYSKSYGCGALQHAVRLKDSTMIKVLLSKEINPNTILSRKLGDMAAYANPWCKEHYQELALKSGRSALGIAVESDRSRDSWIVRLLLRSGANPNSIVTTDHETALLLAIDEGNSGLVKILVAAGADANPSLEYGVKRTPLQRAVEKGRIDIVNILLDNGADINPPPFDRYGATALQFAAIGGYVGIALLLIHRGADVNAPSAKIGGRTALEAAAEHGRIDMLQILLSAGAKVTGTGHVQYNRARELALGNGHRATCRLLEKYSRDIWEDLVAWDGL